MDYLWITYGYSYKDPGAKGDTAHAQGPPETQGTTLVEKPLEEAPEDAAGGLKRWSGAALYHA